MLYVEEKRNEVLLFQESFRWVKKSRNEMQNNALKSEMISHGK